MNFGVRYSNLNKSHAGRPPIANRGRSSQAITNINKGSKKTLFKEEDLEVDNDDLSIDELDHADESMKTASQENRTSSMARRNVSRSAKPKTVKMRQHASQRNILDSRDNINVSDSQNGTIKEYNNRERESGKLYNLDGTEMQPEDYMTMVRQMEKGGGPPNISNFGWSQTAIHSLNEKEKKM